MDPGNAAAPQSMRAAADAPFDVLTMGRIGVDIYPQQVGVSLRDVTTFGKFLEISTSELDLDAVRAARVFWVTVTGLSQEPSRSATLAALETRAKAGITVLDLDYRPMFWESREAARPWVQRALAHATVAVGNLDECDTAVGVTDPQAAAEALRAFGVQLAVVKQGPKGVLASDGQQSVRKDHSHV